MEKFDLQLTDRSKCYFSIFAILIFPNIFFVRALTFQTSSEVTKGLHHIILLFFR